MRGKGGLAVQGERGCWVLCSSGPYRPAISNRNSSGLEFRLTCRKQRTVAASNRNKSRLWGFEPLHCDLSPRLCVFVANRAWTSQLLPISNRQISRNRRCGKTSRPSPQTPRSPFVLIDTHVETESALTHRKQTTAPRSNRYKSRASASFALSGLCVSVPLWQKVLIYGSGIRNRRNPLKTHDRPHV